jgi:fructose-specific phosphotransferase system IIA component
VLHFIWINWLLLTDLTAVGGCMEIEELLHEDHIITHLKGQDKIQVIEELLDILVESNKVKNRETCFQDLMEREQLLSTGLENGLAVPHAKTTATDKMVVSFGLSRRGLDFTSADGKPAHFIFLVISPLDTSGPHLKVLAQISRIFKESGVGEKLLKSESRTDILKIIHESK